MKSAVRKFFKILTGAEKYVLVVILALMMFDLLLQVIFRFVLNNPLFWSEELARIMLIWIGMAGIGYGIKMDSHVKMEAFFNRMPPTLKKIVSIFKYCVIMACMIYIFPFAVRFCQDQASIKSSSMPVTYDWVFLSLCVGIVLLLLHCIEGILEIIWDGDEL